MSAFQVSAAFNPDGWCKRSLHQAQRLDALEVCFGLQTSSTISLGTAASFLFDNYNLTDRT